MVTRELVRAQLVGVELALREGRAVGRELADGTRSRAQALARTLPTVRGDALWHRARAAHESMSARLDGIETELRAQAGQLEGLLREVRQCASVGGAAEPGMPSAPGAQLNEDRAGIVLDVRGRQVAWVFDGARRHLGYSCAHDVLWFGDQFDAALRDLSNRDEGDDLRAVVESALARVADAHRAASCDAPLGEQWGAMAMTRLEGVEAEVLVISDCQVALRPEDTGWTVLTDGRMDALLQGGTEDAELRRVYQEHYQGPGAQSVEEGEWHQRQFEEVFLPLVNRRDVPADQTCWSVTPADPEGAWMAVRATMTVSAIDDIMLLTSDGVRLPFGGDWERTVQIVSRGAADGIRAARVAQGGPSRSPAHAKPFPDMTIVTLEPGDAPGWAW